MTDSEIEALAIECMNRTALGRLSHAEARTIVSMIVNMDAATIQAKAADLARDRAARARGHNGHNRPAAS